MEKVVIVSNVNGPIGVLLPGYNFNRTWPSRGAKIAVDKEIFEAMMYDNGARYMLETGMLYTENMEAKKEVGLEPEDAEKPVNVIILSDKEMAELLTTAPTWKFKEAFSKISREERNKVIDFAIAQEIIPSMDKCDFIKENTGRNVIHAIELNRANKEA